MLQIILRSKPHVAAVRDPVHPTFASTAGAVLCLWRGWLLKCLSANISSFMEITAIKNM